MVDAHPRTSCSRLFKKSEILTVPSQYIYSLMSFFIGNQENFQTNSSVHSTKVETLIVATIYLQLIQNRYRFRWQRVVHNAGDYTEGQ